MYWWKTWRGSGSKKSNVLPLFQNQLRWKETNVNKLATIVMLISLATGCTVGPNYKRPSVDVPGGFRGAAPPNFNSGPVPVLMLSR